MFKRVEKRIRKKEKEEELGLDGDMKEMMGMNDTDSDESSSSGSEGESDDEVQRIRAGVHGDGGSDDEDEDQVEDEEEAESESGSEDEDEEDEPSMTVTEALQNPIYLVSLEPEVKACIVCPGKLLKNPVMIDVHLKSNAHTRRFVHLRDVAETVEADTDARALLREQRHDEKKPAEGQLSKRAQKRKGKLASIKAKREKQKVMKAKYRAKKEAKSQAAVADLQAGSESDGGAETELSDKSLVKPPLLKKRKLEPKPEADVEDIAPKPASKKSRPSKPAPTKSPKKADTHTEKPSAKDRQAAKLHAAKLKPVTPVTAIDGKGAAKAKKRRRSEPS